MIDQVIEKKNAGHFCAICGRVVGPMHVCCDDCMVALRDDDFRRSVNRSTARRARAGECIDCLVLV